jgi:hypothetical protein
MIKKDTLTFNQAGRMVLATLRDPLDYDEFVKQVLTIKPSRAKNPKSVITNALLELEGVLFVRPDAKSIVPLRPFMPGIRFRRIMVQEEVVQGKLLLAPTFWGYLPHHFFWKLESARDFGDRLILRDEKGEAIVPRSTKLTLSPLEEGRRPVQLPALDLSTWMKNHHIRPGDSIIFTIESWEEEQRIFLLHHEPREKTAELTRTIAEEDIKLADTLFWMLETRSDDTLWTQKAIPAAHVVMNGPRETPGHHWWQVVAGDERIDADDIHITYHDSNDTGGAFHRLYELPIPPAPMPQREDIKLDKKDLRKVYRFKAYFKYRKSIWRKIEIQGGQTLEDLDKILRKAFSHDWDHLSGFWKLVKKGNTRRFREVSLGTIYPDFFDPGDEPANDITIAGLRLKSGDHLLYIYDYGDWIQHILELEAVEEPQPGVDYPRITDRNKRRNKYCVECKERGEKTVAKWVCITCSNVEQRDIYLCDACAMKSHEDHYLEEIVY